jgi:hypothetical protein
MNFLQLGTCLFSATAATLWFKAATASVRSKSASDGFQFVMTDDTNPDNQVQLSMGGLDVINTAKAQARWNRWAAASACAAATFQALDTISTIVSGP